MNNYEQYKFYLDLVVSVLLPLISFLVGVTLNKLNKIGQALETQTKDFMAKIDEIEKKIDERDEKMRAEFNSRFTEERQLVYRLLDTMKENKHG